MKFACDDIPMIEHDDIKQTENIHLTTEIIQNKASTVKALKILQIGKSDRKGKAIVICRFCGKAKHFGLK